MRSCRRWRGGLCGQALRRPLGPEAVESIIDELLGHSSLSPQTRQRVVSAADGNPLYVEQLAGPAVHLSRR